MGNNLYTKALGVVILIVIYGLLIIISLDPKPINILPFYSFLALLVFQALYVFGDKMEVKHGTR